MGEEIQIPDRPDSTGMSDDLREFVIALAHTVPDPFWYEIDTVTEEYDSFQIVYDGEQMDAEHRNAIGNAYVRHLMSYGYVVEGWSNHYTKDDHIDKITVMDAPNVADDYNREQATPYEFDVSPSRRLEELGIEYHGDDA
jgi:hypothetical protein